jgi:hypothetical protein
MQPKSKNILPALKQRWDNYCNIIANGWFLVTGRLKFAEEIDTILKFNTNTFEFDEEFALIAN